jgi:hypothetical protein
MDYVSWPQLMSVAFNHCRVFCRRFSCSPCHSICPRLLPTRVSCSRGNLEFGIRPSTFVLPAGYRTYSVAHSMLQIG